MTSDPRCRHCGKPIVSIWTGHYSPREWVHPDTGRPECWIQTAVLPAGADGWDKAAPLEAREKGRTA